MKESSRQSSIRTAWFAVALVQQWVLWTLLPGPAIALGAAQSGVGLALVLGGAASLAYFSRQAETVSPEARCWSRNPICLAMLTCLVGSALWFGTLTGILPIAGFISVVSSDFVFGATFLEQSGTSAARRQ